MRVLAIFLLLTTSAFARLGETIAQAENRYGLSKPVPQTTLTIAGRLIEGDHEYLFEYKGWKIRCALLMASNGEWYIMREEYTKDWNTEVRLAGGSPMIADYERDAILKGEAEGKQWKLKLLADPDPDPVVTLSKQLAHSLGFMGSVWIRDDGAVARVPGGMQMILELPAALKRDAELKAIKEKKLKEGVPGF